MTTFFPVHNYEERLAPIAVAAMRDSRRRRKRRRRQRRRRGEAVFFTFSLESRLSTSKMEHDVVVVTLTAVSYLFAFCAFGLHCV